MRLAALSLLVALAGSCSTKLDPEETHLVLVSGTATLRSDQPLQGVMVSFFATITGAASPLAPAGSHSASPPHLTNAVTDSKGMYGLRLPEGSWEVWIGGWGPDSAVMSQHVADVTLQLPSAVVNVHYLGYRVSGRLRGPGGLSLQTGYLSVLSPTNSTRASVVSGAYRMLVPPDPMTIWANPDPIAYEGGIPRVRFAGVTASSDTTIDFSLDGNAVSGRATGPNGIPLYGGWVSASNADGSAYQQFASDGSYRIYLPTGNYDFTVLTGERGDGTHDIPSVHIDHSQTLDFSFP